MLVPYTLQGSDKSAYCRTLCGSGLGNCTLADLQAHCVARVVSLYCRSNISTSLGLRQTSNFCFGYRAKMYVNHCCRPDTSVLFPKVCKSIRLWAAVIGSLVPIAKRGNIPTDPLMVTTHVLVHTGVRICMLT